MPGKDFVHDLKTDYRTKRPLIVKRLAEFRRAGMQGNRKIFEELCYCIVTAGSSAKMGMRTITVLKDIIHSAGERELQERARAHNVRFWRLRPSYIFQTREYLRDVCGMKLRTLLESFESPSARRDFFAQNKSIKGLGYKEASHFLRNVGYSGYAILDIHILNSLREMGVINPRMRSSGREGYLTIEKKLKRFADEIGIDMDHLDLLLWSRKTGEILK